MFPLIPVLSLVIAMVDDEDDEDINEILIRAMVLNKPSLLEDYLMELEDSDPPAHDILLQALLDRCREARTLLEFMELSVALAFICKIYYPNGTSGYELEFEAIGQKLIRGEFEGVSSLSEAQEKILLLAQEIEPVLKKMNSIAHKHKPVNSVSDSSWAVLFHAMTWRTVDLRPSFGTDRPRLPHYADHRFYVSEVGTKHYDPRPQNDQLKIWAWTEDHMLVSFDYEDKGNLFVLESPRLSMVLRHIYDLKAWPRLRNFLTGQVPKPGYSPEAEGAFKRCLDLLEAISSMNGVFSASFDETEGGGQEFWALRVNGEVVPFNG